MDNVKKAVILKLVILLGKLINLNRNFFRIGAFSLFLAYAGCTQAPVEGGADNSVEQAYLYLDSIRVKAGMTEFTRNNALQLSSANHAQYLDYHSAVSHNETMGLPYATGVNPHNRAVYAGYPSLYVGENLATDESYLSAIDNLMSAIYHRFGFLSFIYDEVGTGYAGNVFVFNMGNTYLRDRCLGASYSGPGLVYTGLCNPDISVLVTDYDSALASVQNQQPGIVTWPPDGSTGTSPVFYEEIPDPLPAQSVSGYPASIQFNPAVHSTVTMQSFTLVDNSTPASVPAVVVMHQGNDPNSKFSGLEFAFFPQDRLKWNTNYTATFQYAEGADVVWSFTTKNLGMTVYTVSASPQTINVSSSKKKFAVYVPPTVAQPSMGSIQYSYPAGMNIGVNFEDQNTLIFSVDASAGQSVTVKYHNNADQFTISFN